MGEETKKPEEKKMEENNKPTAAEEAKKPESDEKKTSEEKKTVESKDAKESKEEAAPAATPPPPQEILLKVFMHCEGCARKVRRCLKGFEGVEDVTTDCKTHKVVVKGEKADPVKVRDRVQQKSHRQVELLSPIPKPPAADDEKKVEKEKEKPEPEEKKPEPPKVIIVVLKVHMHCEACAQEIKKRILRMSGVETAEADLKSSQVSVKGVYDPQKLVDYVYKRTGKKAVIVKQEPEKKKDEDEGKDVKEEKKKVEPEGEEKKEEKKKEEDKEKKEEEGSEKEVNKVVEMKINEYQYYPPRYGMELYAYPPPQMFSDENPNACTVM